MVGVKFVLAIRDQCLQSLAEVTAMFGMLTLLFMCDENFVQYYRDKGSSYRGAPLSKEWRMLESDIGYGSLTSYE